jgi:hypothetical protein
MEAIYSSKTSVDTQRRYITLHNHRCENLKSCNSYYFGSEVLTAVTMKRATFWGNVHHNVCKITIKISHGQPPLVSATVLKLPCTARTYIKVPQVSCRMSHSHVTHVKKAKSHLYTLPCIFIRGTSLSCIAWSNKNQMPLG